MSRARRRRRPKRDRPPAVRGNRLRAWARPPDLPPGAAAGGHELHRERGRPGGPHRAGRPTTSRTSPRDSHVPEYRGGDGSPRPSRGAEGGTDARCRAHDPIRDSLARRGLVDERVTGLDTPSPRAYRASVSSMGSKSAPCVRVVGGHVTPSRASPRSRPACACPRSRGIVPAMRPESEPTPERRQAAELPPDPFEGVKLPWALAPGRGRPGRQADPRGPRAQPTRRRDGGALLPAGIRPPRPGPASAAPPPASSREGRDRGGMRRPARDGPPCGGRPPGPRPAIARELRRHPPAGPRPRPVRPAGLRGGGFTARRRRRPGSDGDDRDRPAWPGPSRSSRRDGPGTGPPRGRPHAPADRAGGRAADPGERASLARFGGFGAVALSLFPDPVTGQYKVARLGGPRRRTPAPPHARGVRQSPDAPSSTPSTRRPPSSRRCSRPSSGSASRRTRPSSSRDAGAGTSSRSPPRRCTSSASSSTRVSGRIARALYPGHDIRIENFRDTRLPEGSSTP